MSKAPSAVGTDDPTAKGRGQQQGRGQGQGLRERIEHQWQLFASDKPGERFVNLHKRRQEHRDGKFSWERILFVGAGLFLIVVGLFFMAVPGPGLPVLVAGLGLMGSEALFMARGLDWAEQKLRPPVLKLKARWDALSPRTRLLFWCAAGTAGATAGVLLLMWWK
ncbi:PGPGW domain-containing protein [Verrucomicrobium sp. BvORR106]|uniref:PGPGW domain-containing protein n=1 Tax=Verrucomicrobium sp. BvORR106 TaxID=1403819 RepID=UPI0005702A43|nr:PGPGW domain-containing protein [Verrucomicrobium sp. BvORR106]